MIDQGVKVGLIAEKAGEVGGYRVKEIFELLLVVQQKFMVIADFYQVFFPEALLEPAFRMDRLVVEKVMPLASYMSVRNRSKSVSARKYAIQTPVSASHGPVQSLKPLNPPVNECGCFDETGQ